MVSTSLLSTLTVMATGAVSRRLESVKMNGIVKETRNLLIEIREELLHSEVETCVIEKIDLAISNLNDLEKEIEDENEATEICLKIIARVIKHLPTIQSLIDSILN